MSNVSVISLRDTVTQDVLVINCTSRTKDYFQHLSPFRIGRDMKLYSHYTAQNVENAWQYSKVYAQHVDAAGKPTEAYFKWAKRGWDSSYADRYPMGKGVKPLFSYWDGEQMDYIEARKRIYIPLYAREVVKTEAYKTLRAICAKGKPVAIQDFDAYNYEALGYSAADIINDPNHKMGHGFVLKFLLDGVVSVSETGGVFLPAEGLRSAEKPEQISLFN